MHIFRTKARRKLSGKNKMSLFFYNTNTSTLCNANGLTCTTLGINNMPNEILIHIFSLLDSESIQAVAGVSLRWYELAMTPAVWRRMRLVLCMKNYQQIAQNVIPTVASSLKSVKLQYFKLYSLIRKPLISYCPNLTHLEITISQVNECIFEDLKSWPNLKFLSFRNSLIMEDSCDGNRNYVFSLPFEHLEKLKTVTLSNFALTMNSLNSMLSCKHLVSINIEKMKNIPSNFLESLISSKLTTLKELYIYGDTLTDSIMCLISQCKTLTCLHIMTCKTLFDSSLLHLGRIKSLKSLKLRHGYFSSNALLTYFSKNIFENLTFLSLSRCLHVTMNIVLAIKLNAPNLKELSFYLCPFVVAPEFDRYSLEKLFSIQLLLD